MRLVFVYGTLKRGGSNHACLAGQGFLGEACTRAGYALFELDGYPGMVRVDADDGGVSGEVWSVDEACLAVLDELEGIGEGLYRRELVALTGSFSDRCVEAYLYGRTTVGRRRIGGHWPV